MAKKFTIKHRRILARIRIRKQKLKIDPITFGVKTTPQMKNLDLIHKMEAHLEKQS